MMLWKPWSRRRCITLTLGLIAACVAIAGAEKAAPIKKGKSTHGQPEAGLFTNSQIPRIEIEIPETGLDQLRGSPQRAWGGADKRPAAKAIVREGGKVYKDVAIHLKGAAGSFRGVDDNPALTLNFDKNVKGQTFHGLERFSLNNSVQDPSLLNEQICREMFAAAGVPVPRATHALVRLNGRELGVYVLVEAANKQFLAQHFKNPNGNLYDGGFLKDITDNLEKSAGDNPQDRSDLARLAEAASAPSTERFARLSKLLDVDQFLNYLALDILMCDWDGYALNRNNYRVYHEPDSDKFTFIPHGLDQMFGVMRAGPDMPIYPRMQGLVAQALLATTEGRNGYREHVRQMMSSIYDVPTLTNRVWQLAAKIRPVLEEQRKGEGRSYDREVSAFCRRIVARADYVREQLSRPDRAVKFSQTGATPIQDWKARTDFGKATLDEVTEGGRKLLHISTTASAVGVWLTRARLEPGRYRLEGKVKCRGVVADPGDRRGGAGLRIGSRRFDQKLTGDADWTNMAFEFETQEVGGGQFGFMGPIEDDVPEVELRCELRAAKGEVWFDRDSLRLVKK